MTTPPAANDPPEQPSPAARDAASDDDQAFRYEADYAGATPTSDVGNAPTEPLAATGAPGADPEPTAVTESISSPEPTAVTEPTEPISGPEPTAPPEPTVPPYGGPPPAATPPPYGGIPPYGATFAGRYGLVRPVSGRYLAGVCAAIGRATNTDPVLWRVLLAVLTLFGGVGLLAYLIGWLLIPSEGDSASALEAILGRGQSATPLPVVVLVVIAAIVLFAFVVSDGLRPAVLGTAVIAGAVALLFRNGQFGRVAQPPGGPPGSPSPWNPAGAPSAGVPGGFGPMTMGAPAPAPTYPLTTQSPTATQYPPATQHPPTQYPTTATEYPPTQYPPTAQYPTIGPAAGVPAVPPTVGVPTGAPQPPPRPPASGPPLSGPPLSGPPLSGPPLSGPPASDPAPFSPPWPVTGPPNPPLPPLTVPPMTFPPGYRPPFAPHGPYASSSPYAASLGYPTSPAGYPPDTSTTYPGLGGVPAVQQPPKPRRPKSRLGRVIIFLACLALGALAVVDVTGANLRGGAYPAVALAVIGLGLVIGAWLGRARWFIAIGIILSLVLFTSTVVEEATDSSPNPGLRATPTSVAAIEPDYRVDFGDARIDLSQVDFTGETVTMNVNVDFGNLTIVLPPDVNVVIESEVSLGEAQVLNERWGGIDKGYRTVTDTGLDGPGGGNLRINARVDLGNLEVHR